jgi:hypothetical protein
VFVLPSAVIVLDGASAPEPTERDGGWLAQTLGDELAGRSTARPRVDLTDALHDAIAAVAGTAHAS